ncbi:hypothetical protein QAD02_015171 [Eretmocerus hayati]|uniref:Uncharacterized protein n=1 Tax=Eretmocerus hayati TaxID=131215 RepID=A0ACC2P9Z0_9HYME|nr:hypothetical protein QAD02_015171 [Eretmocerus hayati]
MRLSIAEGEATLKSSRGWVEVTGILNAISEQKPRTCADRRKTWDRSVKCAKAEFMESKKVPENGAPKHIISPFSMEVLHTLACLRNYQAGRDLPSQPSATIRQTPAYQEISSSSAVGTLGRVAQFSQTDCPKVSSTEDQLSHTISTKSDLQALLQSQNPAFGDSDGQDFEMHRTTQSSNVTNFPRSFVLLDLNKVSGPMAMFPSASAPIRAQITNNSIPSAECSSASILPLLSGKENMNLPTPRLASPGSPESLGSFITCAISSLRKNSRMIYE